MGGEPGEPSILPAPPCCLQAFLLYRGILWVKIGPASLRAGSKRFLKSGLLAGQNPANGSGRRFSGSRKSNRVGSDRVGSGRIGSGRARRCSKFHGKGQTDFGLSRAGSARVTLTMPDPRKAT